MKIVYIFKNQKSVSKNSSVFIFLHFALTSGLTQHRQAPGPLRPVSCNGRHCGLCTGVRLRKEENLGDAQTHDWGLLDNRGCASLILHQNATNSISYKLAAMWNLKPHPLAPPPQSTLHSECVFYLDVTVLHQVLLTWKLLVTELYEVSKR